MNNFRKSVNPPILHFGIIQLLGDFVNPLKMLHQTDHLIGCKVLKAFLCRIQRSSSCPVEFPVGGVMESCHMGRNTLRNTGECLFEIPWNWWKPIWIASLMF